MASTVCDTCRNEAAQGWVPIDTPGWVLGQTLCKMGDRCRFEYSRRQLTNALEDSNPITPGKGTTTSTYQDVPGMSGSKIREAMKKGLGRDKHELLRTSNPANADDFFDETANEIDETPERFSNADRARFARRRIKTAQDFVMSLLDAGAVKTPMSIAWEFTNKDGRANAGGGKLKIQMYRHDEQKSYVHELGHNIERMLTELNDKQRERLEEDGRSVMNPHVRAFLERRGKGSPPRRLGNGYADDEMTRPDDYLSPYVGKIYQGDSEVMAMGLQWLYEDPLWFAENDPDMFDFVIGMLRGELK